MRCDVVCDGFCWVVDRGTWVRFLGGGVAARYRRVRFVIL